MQIKKLIVFLMTLELGILPSFAKIDGGISKSHFYDTDSTIMTEVLQSQAIKTEKYWEKNLLYFNKYRPLFMLSNKELYDLMPKKNVSVSQRISTPSVYNISLKSTSIKAIALSSPIPQVDKVTPKIQQRVTSGNGLSSLYEQSKNPEVDSGKKIEAAILLKNSGNSSVSNYNLAIDLLDDVIAKEPYNAYAYNLKAELYVAQKNPQLAMRSYVEALKINPTSKQCCLGIAKILEPTNKELAQRYYEMAK